MISAEVPVLFAQACELFIIELTHKAWNYTEYNKRRTLQRIDITCCIQDAEIFDFLIDLIPKEEFKVTQFRKKTGSFGGPMQPNQIMDSYIAHNNLHSIQPQMQFSPYQMQMNMGMPMGMPQEFPTEKQGNNFSDSKMKENQIINNFLSGEVKEEFRNKGKEDENNN